MFALKYCKTNIIVILISIRILNASICLCACVLSVSRRFNLFVQSCYVCVLQFFDICKFLLSHFLFTCRHIRLMVCLYIYALLFFLFLWLITLLLASLRSSLVTPPLFLILMRIPFIPLSIALPDMFQCLISIRASICLLANGIVLSFVVLQFKILH